MKQLSLYLKSALYNIRHNKAYAIFCVGGTALTFIFIILVLQLSYIIANNTAPAVHADRTIKFTGFPNKKQHLSGTITIEELPTFMQFLKGHETYAISHLEPVHIIKNGQLYASYANFINANYWEIFKFDFMEGRPFTEKEHADPVAVVLESFAKSHFKNGSAINQSIEFQGNTYKIIGIVKDVSILSAETVTDIMVPYTFNKYIPTWCPFYTINILFPREMPKQLMQQHLSQAINSYYQLHNIPLNITPKDIPTLLEKHKETYGGDLFAYGTTIIVLLLLTIPAINIITLSIANINNRSAEVGIRRALGADKITSFKQIIIENFILVIIGIIISLFLIYPTIYLFDATILKIIGQNGHTISAGIDWTIILMGIIPLALLFTFLSGGLPAYILIQRKITDLQKGGSKC